MPYFHSGIAKLYHKSLIKGKKIMGRRNFSQDIWIDLVTLDDKDKDYSLTSEILCKCVKIFHHEDKQGTKSIIF